MSKFLDKKPESFKEEFKAYNVEDGLVAKRALQSGLDVDDVFSRVMGYHTDEHHGYRTPA